MSKFHSKKIAVTTHRRQIKADWTIETQTIAKVMQEEIDAQVLWNLLKQGGWVEVEVSRYIDNHHAVDIAEWVKYNTKHKHKRRGANFLFESEQDANWFRLRWLR